MTSDDSETSVLLEGASLLWFHVSARLCCRRGCAPPIDYGSMQAKRSGQPKRRSSIPSFATSIPLRSVNPASYCWYTLTIVSYNVFSSPDMFRKMSFGG